MFTSIVGIASSTSDRPCRHFGRLRRPGNGASFTVQRPVGRTEFEQFERFVRAAAAALAGRHARLLVGLPFQGSEQRAHRLETGCWGLGPVASQTQVSILSVTALPTKCVHLKRTQKNPTYKFKTKWSPAVCSNLQYLLFSGKGRSHSNIIILLSMWRIQYRVSMHHLCRNADTQLRKTSPSLILVEKW